MSLVVSASCATDSSFEVTSKEARDSMCLHLVSGWAFLGGDRSSTDIVLGSLELDARLLNEAGEERLATQLREAIDGIGSGQAAGDKISVYLRDTADADEVERIRRRLEEGSEITDVEFVSKEQAFEEFKAAYENDPEFYESLPSDALPASLRARVQGEDAREELITDLEALPEVEHVAVEGEVFGLGQPLLRFAETECQMDIPFDLPGPNS